MDKVVDLKKYLPKVVQEIKGFTTICESQNASLEDAWSEIDRMLDNQFLLTADIDGIKRWESILNIKPKATNTLEDRRFRVLSRVNSKLPYTFTRLSEQLDVLCGNDGFTLDINTNEFRLIVRIALAAKEQFLEANELISRQAPVNMMLDISLLYNTHYVLAASTHQELAGYTHTQLREELIS